MLVFTGHDVRWVMVFNRNCGISAIVAKGFANRRTVLADCCTECARRSFFLFLGFITYRRLENIIAILTLKATTLKSEVLVWWWLTKRTDNTKGTLLRGGSFSTPQKSKTVKYS